MRNKRISFLSFICACMVVMIHVRVDAPIWTWQWWVLSAFRNVGFTRSAVPCFFVIFGYYLAAHFNEQGWYGRAVLSRMKSIVVPFLSWFGLYSLLSLVIRLSGLNAEDAPPLLPLWFLKSIALITLVSPIFSIKRDLAFCGVLLLTLLLYMSSPLMPGDFFVFTFSLKGLFYSAVGVALRRYSFRIDLSKKKYLISGVVGLGLVMLRTYCSTVNGRWVPIIDAMMIPVNMFFMWALVLRIKACPDWGKLAFPLYMVHVPVWHVIGLFVEGNAIVHTYPVSSYFLLVFIVISVSYVLIRMIGHIPFASSVLFGGRKIK